MAKDVSSRANFNQGDVRVMFEYVRAPCVDVLAQQVQTGDEAFGLRPWNLFSETYQKIHEDPQPENAKNCDGSLFLVWCRFADFLLSQLQSDDIELIRDHYGHAGKDVADRHFRDLEEAMKYAKWVRPVAFVALFSAVKLILVQARLLMQLRGTLEDDEGTSLIRALSAVVPRGVAEASVALCVALGLQLCLTCLAWRSANRGLIR